MPVGQTVCRCSVTDKTKQYSCQVDRCGDYGHNKVRFNGASMRHAKESFAKQRCYISKEEAVIRTFQLVFVATLALCAVSPASSQAIRGQVVDSTTNLPVGIGFVILLDESGAELSRALTASTGRFVIQVARPGRYRLRSERIGYRPWTSRPIDIGSGETLSHNLAVTALPIQLSSMTVEASTECRNRPQDSRNTALLWNEARKALSAATWSANQRLFRITLHSYARDLGRRRRRVSREQIEVSRGNFRNPYSSIEPKSLADSGYIQQRDGYSWFYAPDANVLLDDTFLATHCFLVARDDDQHESMVGLRFQPAPGHTQPDVEGTLWLDESSAELRRIEYKYTRLPYGAVDDRVGGNVEFLALPSGAWVVSRWEIRTPQITEYTNWDPYRGRPQAVTGFRDTGGEILEIVDLNGERIYSSPNVAVISGTVFDSTRGRPLQNATFEILNTGYTARTDRDGRFSLTTLLRGEYLMTFRHIRADSIGYSPPTTELPISPGNSISLQLAIPSVDLVMQQLCPNREVPNEPRIITGVVRTTEGAVVSGARVAASWQRINVPGEYSDNWIVRDMNGETETDEFGSYVICFVPSARPVTIQAVGDDWESAETLRVSFRDNGVEVAEGGVNAPYRFYSWDGPVWKQDIVVIPTPATQR